MSTLQIFMLSPIQLRCHEQAIQLPTAKAIGLLAVLALAETPQWREILASLAA